MARRDPSGGALRGRRRRAGSDRGQVREALGVGRQEWPADGPRPGDPRSSGPRPRGRPRDVCWLALAAALVALTTLQLARLVWVLVTDDAVAVTGGGATLGFLITVVWLLTIWWLMAGSWRRTVWGCPFEHTTSASEHRRCRRHALVPDPVDDAP